MTEAFERQFEIAKREQELAEAKAQQAAEKAKMTAALEKINRAQEERQEAAFQENLRRAIRATGMEESMNVDPADFLGVVRSSMDFDIQPDGSFQAKNPQTKQFIDFGSALKAFASANPKYFSIASIRKLQTKPSELSRDQMSVAEKIAFIEANGYDSFVSLPRTKPMDETPISEMTAEKWNQLSKFQRSEILGRMGSDWLAEMLRETRVRR